MMTNGTDLLRLKKKLEALEELLVDQADDEAYVARGNGFCDSKYSPEFLEEQIALIQRRIKELEG